MKKFLSVVLVLILAVALAAPAFAASEQTIYLKGTGSDFTEEWNNVFYVDGYDADTVGDDPSVWHIVTTGKKVNLTTAMQLDFGDNGVWEWTPDMGFSTNGGGKNPGWVVIAPYDWEISYVNKGKNNNSNSFMKTTESGNIQFNISGFHQGSPDEVDLYTFIYINKYVDTFGVVGEGFEFDVFPEDGPFDAPLTTLVTDEYGYAEFTFDPALEEGTYIVRERVPEGFAPVDDLVFTVDAEGNAKFVDDIQHIINISLGNLEVTDDVMEKFIKEYHKPVYKTFSTDNTLSSVSDTIVGGHQWFRYLEIDTTATSDVYTTGIPVEISRSSTGSSIEGIGYYYNVKINEAGELVISFDEDLISASVVARVFTDAPPSWGSNGGHEDIVLGGTMTAFAGWQVKGTNNTFVLPEDCEKVYLYVHFGALSYYETNEEGERIVESCEVDYEEEDEREYPGEVTMSVTQGDVSFYNGPLGLVEDLVAGDYLVTIYADGVELASKTVTVIAGETVNADFGKLITPELGEKEIICAWFTH